MFPVSKVFSLPVLLLTINIILLSCKADSKKTPEALQAIQGDPELVHLTQLLQNNPGNDTLLFERARVYYRLNGFDEALADVGKAINLDSNQADYYHLMANVLIDYARPNDSRKAVEVLKTAAAKFPDRIPTLLKLSEFHLIIKQHSEALSALHKILLRDPQNAEAYFMSGRIALDKGDTLTCLTALKKAVQLDANLIDAWMFLGSIYSTRKSPQAFQYFDNALRIDSNLLAAREYKGALHKRRGEFKQAFEIYRDIIRRNPDYSNAYFDMGMIYLELDSLSQAYNNFDIAIKTDALFVDAYYYRGVTAETQGNLPAALADYTRAYKMNPGFLEARESKEALEKKGIR